MNDTSLIPRLLYRDAMMLVIDKPAGLPVHLGGHRRGPHLGEFLDELRFGLPQAPALAHRLDKDTSGCLVLGRHRRALAQLGELFAQNKIRKTYWAIVAGVPEVAEGVIDLPLKKQSPDPRAWRMMVAEADDPAAQTARTRYRVLASHAGLSWLELSPETGRTHQLRVHCAAMGWPMRGDAVYGPHPAPGEPLQLHANALAIPLYPKKPTIIVEAEPPEHMQQKIQFFSSHNTPV